jgi:two-component system, OmpR family, KDP operon response regulator KdpE
LSCVLVVDDDPDIRGLVRELLERAEHLVVEAPDGNEGLRLFYAEQPDLVILDVSMPGLDGWGTLERIRELSDVPVLMLTARAEELDKVRGLRAGADDYVTKPFGPGELVARIQAALRRAGRDTSEPRIEADGLVIDLAAHSIWLDGDEVHLTPIEFSLLHLLAANRGLLMTHRQLLVEVWGPEYADATPLLRTHIANLRRKLQSGGRAASFIRTDSGIGYRFNA